MSKDNVLAANRRIKRQRGNMVYVVYWNYPPTVSEIFATMTAAKKYIGDKIDKFTITPWEVVK